MVGGGVHIRLCLTTLMLITVHVTISLVIDDIDVCIYMHEEDMLEVMTTL